MSLIFVLSLASSAFAVTVPAGAAIKPDGTRLYVPNQTNGYVYIWNTATHANVVNINVYGAPMGMVVSPDGRYLYVSVSNPGSGFSFVRIFDISGADPANYVRTVNLGAGAAKGIAITPDGRTLYVADSNNATEQIHVIDVTNPLSPGGEIATISGLPSTNVYGVAVKPDGSRLYVTHRGNGVNDGSGNLYMYNITNRTSPSYVGGIPSLSWPSYLLVTPDGIRLIVRTSRAASVPYTDYIIYDTTNDSLAQLFNSSVDTNNEDVSATGNSHAAESLSMSPNGLFFYISHYIIPPLPAGPSVRTFARVTANPDLLANQWLVAAGDTAKDFSITSPDGRIIYLTYSADGSYVMYGNTGVPAGNGAPTAPIITYPLADATNVAGSVTWLPAQDDGGYQLLTYEIETIEAVNIPTNNWVRMSYTAANATSAPLLGLAAGGKYYIRVRAYDGANVGPWAYSGPFTMASVLPPVETAWVSHYNLTVEAGGTFAVTINWSALSDATSYDLRYRQGTDTSWTTLTGVSFNDNPLDSNPNHRLTGLSAFSSYEVSVRGVGVGGAGQWFDPPHVFYTIRYPQWIDSFGVGSNEAHLIWENTGANSYTISYGTDANATNEGEIAGLTDPSNYLLAGLLVNTTYYVKVKAVYTGIGSSEWSPIATFTTSAGTAPLWISHFNVDATSAHLIWSPMAGAVSYTVSYGTDANATNLGTIPGLTNPNDYFLSGLTPNTRYYTKVQAVYAAGTSGWSPIDNFYTLKAPWLAHYNVTTTGAFMTWEVIPAATSYTLRVWPAGGVTAEYSVTTPPQQLTGLTPNTQYYARIRANNVGGYSDWSNTDTFTTIDTPWLSHYGVTREAAGTYKATMIWLNIPAATSYVLQYWRNGTTTEVTITAPATTRNITGLVASSLYYAKIRAVTAAGSSEWSNIDSFWTVTGPTWLSHHDVTANSAHMLWESVAGVSGYKLEYSIDQNFLTGVTTINASSATNEVGLVSLLANTTYYARVRAEYAGGRYSDWVTDSFYTLEAPWLSHYGVTREAAGTFKATMIWQNIPAATSYVLQYWRNGTTIEVSIASPATTRDITGLVANSLYYAKIRAVTAAGSSEWSNIDSFWTVTGPQWLSHHDVTANSAHMLWETVAGVSGYKLEYSTDATFTTGVTTVNASSTTNEVGLSALLANTIYYVRVRAQYAGGSYSDWANDSFYTMETPWLSHYGVTREAAGTYKATMIWQNIPAATSYVLQYWRNGTTTEVSIASPATTRDITGLVANSLYYAKIRAVTAAGSSEWSNTDSFWTVTGPQWLSHHDVTANSAHMLWEIVAGVSGYKLEYSTDATFTTGVTTVNASSATNEVGLSGLIVNTTYYVRVRAEYAGGRYSDWANDSFLTTATPMPTILRLENSLNQVTTEGFVYDTINIIGSGFGADPGNGNRDTLTNHVSIDGLAIPDVFPDSGIEVYYWSDTAISIGIPRSIGITNIVAGNRPIQVTANSVASNLANLTVRPRIYALNPTSGSIGTRVTIEGTAFGNSQGTGEVTFFNGVSAGAAVSWSNTTIEVNVPATAATGPVIVRVNGALSNDDQIFTIGGVGTTAWMDHYLVQRQPDTTYTVFVNWGAVLSAVNYDLRYRIVGAPVWTTLTNVTINDNPADTNPNHRLTGLTGLVTYEVSVRAKDGVGTLGNWFTPSHLMYMIDMPWLAHYGVSREAGGTFKATMIWMDVYGASSYVLQYWRAGSATQEVYPVAPATTRDITGLAANQIYYARIKAVRVGGGESGWSNTDSFLTLQGPLWIDSFLVTTTEAHLIWDHPMGGALPYTYTLSYGTDANATSSGETPNLNDTQALDYLLSALTGGTTYFVKVRAVYTGVGSSEWSPIEMLTTEAAGDLPPSRIIDLRATKVLPSNVRLDWSAAMDPDITGVAGYRVFHSTSPSGPWTQLGVDLSAATLTYVHTGALTDLNNHYYYVVAFDTVGGVAQPSNIASVLRITLTYNAAEANKFWVSVPYNNPYTTAQTMMLDMPLEVIQISRFNPVTKQWDMYNLSTGLPVNFPIVTGEGYEVLISNTTTIIFVGSHNPTFIFNLTNLGENLISVPYNAAYTDARSIVDSINLAPQPGTCISITRLNSANQVSESLTWIVLPMIGGRWSGVNFNFAPGEGYKIVINAPTSWRPTVN